MKQLIILFSLPLILLGCHPTQPAPHSIPEDPSFANPIQVSLNGIGLPENPDLTYRVLVLGHIYGSIEGNDLNPAYSLISHIPELKASNLSMLVSLGDIVKQANEEDFSELNRQFLSKLSFPVFNTPGNHDVEDRSLYEKLFGQTFFSFKYGSARMIFLDSERQECAIDSEQLGMLRNSLHEAQIDSETNFVLIFMHKTLFFNIDELIELQNPVALPNQWKCFASPEFPEIIENLLIPLSTEKPIFIFAGDVGATGNLTPYYETLEGGHITYIMTGLGDTSKDSGILITISNNSIQLEIFPLTDEIIPPLEIFNPEYWIQKANGN